MISLITDRNYEVEVIKEKLPVLVVFSAEWCVPCKFLTPIVEEIAKDLIGKIKVVKIDVDTNPLITQKLKIQSIPVLILYKNSEILWQSTGSYNKNDLLINIKPHLDLNN